MTASSAFGRVDNRGRGTVRGPEPMSADEFRDSLAILGLDISATAPLIHRSRVMTSYYYNGRRAIPNDLALLIRTWVAVGTVVKPTRQKSP